MVTSGRSGLETATVTDRAVRPDRRDGFGHNAEKHGSYIYSWLDQLCKHMFILSAFRELLIQPEVSDPAKEPQFEICL